MLISDQQTGRYVNESVSADLQGINARHDYVKGFILVGVGGGRVPVQYILYNMLFG